MPIISIGKDYITKIYKICTMLGYNNTKEVYSLWKDLAFGLL